MASASPGWNSSSLAGSACTRWRSFATTRFRRACADRSIERQAARPIERAEYFVDRLSQGIATIAAAFYPRPVIFRFSDFKTNEYAKLVGGSVFETHEENPMLGWRGASRYSHPDFKEAFLLEVEAARRVRDIMGLTNLKMMVPFCRTPEEGKSVLAVTAEGGLERGKNGLEIVVMAEIPSNILLQISLPRSSTASRSDPTTSPSWYWVSIVIRRRSRTFSTNEARRSSGRARCSSKQLTAPGAQ